MEPSSASLTPLDELFLQRAYELAARGIGTTSPNPPVGAVVVRDDRIVGEGYHHRAGGPHAETFALEQAGGEARGATLYISLEPCGHVGATPPCADAVVAAGIARVVAGTLDPTEHGGAALLRDAGVDFTVSNDVRARELIEAFALAAASTRPYVSLKMAMSLDGAVARREGAEERLSSEEERRYVRELRIAHDAVMVGAGTVRVDDPRLTVRPAHDRPRPYVRVVLCGRDGISRNSRILASQEGYARTLVLAPGALAQTLDELRGVADVIAVGPPESERLDLARALRALRERGIYSVLCEGGPTVAGRLVAERLVDRFYWAVAPRFLPSDGSVRVLRGLDAPGGVALRFDRIERAGADVVLAGTFADV
ncbi:MAG TPA: bifunctional diaminohydroxyphosphoribosylaminopyrimidine deaminase/5-amino-6-(5-phosphoribosylamino)uracil reductase RibD [Candidatus Cybelea sp.]|nr:bifunctional diaminohydroxyphosphoribosylaminopyrimidine deaminase/5-amino-6-(5-phosphoribosylamino)uracil reductase RibD [Candidatus Cybelea sp.]